MPTPNRAAEAALKRRIARRDLVRAAAGLGLVLPSIQVLSACGLISAGQDEAEDNGDAPAAPGSISLTGSGATFPDPIYQVWIDEFRSVRPDVSINYQSVGSGQGKRDFINNVTDFGSSDAYLTDEELTSVPGALHIPTVIGAVAVTYNLEEVDDLKLSGETLAAIYLGDITSWDDPRIQDENPEIDLPDKDIGAIFRSDGAGTTWIFTDYLSKVSEDWSERVGTGTSVQWPVGFGGEKNAGVMASVQQTPGSVGYVELIYSLVIGMPTVAMQNRTGNFVMPTLEAVQAAAAGYLDELPDDLRVSITDPPTGEDSYPISGLTWILLREEQEDREKTEALIDFVFWALTEGDEYALNLHYSPLPDEVRVIALEKLEQIHVDGEQIFELPEDI
jgi:phosphate transport system substrate-binding protein